MTAEEYREQVRGASDIIEVIGRYLALHRRGRRFLGLCPFHKEKTPSFSVDAELQLFHCFGCKAGGDVFKFVERIENLDFPEALRHLAERAGLPPPPSARDSGVQPGMLERMRAALSAAQELFRAQLESPAGAPARRYLLEIRGLRSETIDAFGLGWAPPARDALLQPLLRRGLELAVIEGAGLAIVGDVGDAVDRFRGRVQFPSRDPGGRLVGFGGRILDQGEPKYLNSPETSLFQKGRLLYGYDRARAALRAGRPAILVEGYLDLIALHQAGIDSAVAPLGTALTPDHARLLKRSAARVVVSFDRDQAGIKATERAIEVLLAEGLEVSCLRLPAGEDPDSLVRARGAEAFRELLDGASSALDFLLDEAQQRWDLRAPSGKVAALDYVAPILARIPSELIRDGWVPRVAERVGVEDRLLIEQLRQALKRSAGRMDREEVQRSFALKLSERRLIRFLVECRGAAESVLARLAQLNLHGLAGEGLLRSLAHQLREQPDRPLALLIDRLARPEDRELLVAAAMAEEPAPTAAEAEGCLIVLERRALAGELQQYQQSLEAEGSAVEEDRLLEQKLELARRALAIGSRGGDAPR